MATKTKKVDWGGLSVIVNSLFTGASGPGDAGTEITATAAEINLAADISARGPVAIADGATYTFLAANSGLVHVVPNLTATCVFSFPTASAGLTFEVWYGGAAADAQDWNFVLSSGFFIGGVSFLDTDAGAGADEVHLGVYSNGSSNDNFDVVTPAAGTRLRFLCNGTNWYVNGVVCSATVPTMADS
jgi:hypothetical protein